MYGISHVSDSCRASRDRPIAQQQLKSVLSFCNAPQMNAPEAYIQFKPGLISDDGQVTDELTEDFLRGYIAASHAFIARVYTVAAAQPLSVSKARSCP